MLSVSCESLSSERVIAYSMRKFTKLHFRLVAAVRRLGACMAIGLSCLFLPQNVSLTFNFCISLHIKRRAKGTCRENERITESQSE